MFSTPVSSASLVKMVMARRIHSLILDISIVPLQVHLELQHGYYVEVNMSKRYRQLRVKDFPKVPTWWLEWDSNLQPSICKAINLPLSHPLLYQKAKIIKLLQLPILSSYM